MLYCSIEEAWGNYTQEKEVINQNNNNQTDNNQTDNNHQNNKKVIKNLIENFTESITEEKLSDENCSKIIKHVMKCKKCQKKLKEMLTPKLISILKNLLEDYRDLFVLLLVGISILLFFNLVSNISN
jgi:uncharacterized membrane-anchored protein YjiN (DUF445 family)